MIIDDFVKKNSNNKYLNNTWCYIYNTIKRHYPPLNVFGDENY
ncbi:hypothetical protein FHS70_002881 [Flammeovirga yaeyamensis]|nr:hypothetical protein [Flammeovirga yaeyamensis]